MEITIFGAFLCIFFIFFLIKNRNVSLKTKYKKIFFASIISLLVFDVGYFAKIGSFTVEYNYVFTIVSFCYALLCIFKYKIRLNNFTSAFLFLLCIFMGILIPKLFNITYQSVTFDDQWDNYIGTGLPLKNVSVSLHSYFLLARIFIFLTQFLVFVTLSEKNDLKYYMTRMFNISVLILFLSFAEMIVSNFFHPMDFRSWSFTVFGHSTASYYVPRKSFGIYMPMLFMREPSSYGYTILFFIINNIAYYYTTLSVKQKKQIVFTSICLTVLLILSKSLSSYIYVLSVFFVLLYLSKNKGDYILILSISSIGIMIVLFNTMGDRIDVALNGLKNIFLGNYRELSSGSENIRLYSIYNNITYFFKYIFMGCGLGSMYSYSSIATVLCNIGIIGSLWFIKIIKNCTNQFYKVDFFSWFSLVIIFCIHFLTGHLSFILYLERIAYMYLILKYLNIIKIDSKIMTKKNIKNGGNVLNEI